MPLDFRNPRADPTLGSRTTPPIQELRDEHPRSHILNGLRGVGGYWTRRTHEEMERIKRYREALEADEGPTAKRWKGKFPDAVELVTIRDALEHGDDLYLSRPGVEPEISLHHEPELVGKRIRLLDRETRMHISMLMSDEQLDKAPNTTLVLVDVLTRAFDKLYKPTSIKIQSH